MTTTQQDILDAPTTSKVAVYSAIEAGIAAMLDKHGGVLTNPPVVRGNATALEAVKTDRKELIKFRTTLEKARVSEKAESLAYGKLIDAEAKRIQAFATPLEMAYDNIVTREQGRLEAILLIKIEAERQRIAAHRAQIQVIKDVRETAYMCRTAARVQQLIDGMPALFMTRDFGEFQAEAVTVYEEVGRVLIELHSINTDSEAQAVERQREREEFEAEKAAQQAAAKQQAAEFQRQRDEFQAGQAAALEIAKLHAAEMLAREQAAQHQQAELTAQKEKLQAEREAAEREFAELSKPAIQQPDQPYPPAAPPTVVLIDSQNSTVAPVNSEQVATETIALMFRPSDDEIINHLADYYNVSPSVVLGWLEDLVFMAELKRLAVPVIRPATKATT